MSAKKKTNDEAPAAASAKRTRVGRGGRWLAITGVIVAVTGGACYAVWQQVRGHVLAGVHYQVEPETIAISPTPPWIKTDVKAEVIRDASFAGPLSLLDNELTVRIAGLFSTHPWVAQVLRVSKRYPAGLDVVLSYRRPVAMVELRDGALPIDAQGVVLPTFDFTSEEAAGYPRIAEINNTPAGAVGKPWGDPRVAGAARVAAALLNDWQALKFSHIVTAGGRPGREGVDYVYAVFTTSGTRILWGAAPAGDGLGEAPAAQKVTRLKQYLADNGSLDGPDGPQQLKFSETGELVRQARPAIKSIPKRDE